MSTNIPLKLSRGGSLVSASAGDGVKLNLPINFSRKGGNSRLFSGNRQEQTLLAVAAAASLQKADVALRKAKEAADNPEDVLVPDLDNAKLDELIQAVAKVQDDAKEGQTPSAEQEAAARAIGANPVLVRAAFDKMAEDGACLDNGISWVAAVDGQLLARSAREGVRRVMLDKVPLSKDIETLSTRIESLEDKVKELEERCKPTKAAGAKAPAAGTK